MSIFQSLSNLPGWKTKRKLIVFESDDWGSIRIPDVATRNVLKSNGVKVDSNFFTWYDGLEQEEDLQRLFEVLKSKKDSKGNCPVFTTLNILGNPDFKKIEDHNFSSYYWQHVEDTYREYGEDPQTMRNTWKKGMEDGVIVPSFHGREHLHISRWMHGLQEGLPVTCMAFKHRVTGIHPYIAGEDRGEYQAAYDADSIQDIEVLNKTITEGLDAFEKYFGYRSGYFVPANGFFPAQLLPVLNQCGIKYICTPKFGKQPTGTGTYRQYFRYPGLRTREGLIYISRNASFEPSNFGKPVDWVNKCMAEIATAFKWKKAAVIGTHRVNFAGRIDPDNRAKGISLLKELLDEILTEWPDVEFVSSETLGGIMSGQKEIKLV